MTNRLTYAETEGIKQKDKEKEIIIRLKNEERKENGIKILD